MRIWSIDPAQLDRAALVACWRESLLAQKVLAGQTRGYTHHPQLERFRAQPDPLASIGSYLDGLAAEATDRGYHFNTDKILHRLVLAEHIIPVTSGQLDYEWQHLLGKTAQRAPQWHTQLAIQQPRAHSLFRVEAGPVADWERV